MLAYKTDLKNGDEGPEVLSLQNRLIELGYNRVRLKDGSIGRIVPEGYFGDVTEACLENFQAKVQDVVAGVFVPDWIREQYPFSIDGIMNYSDWYLLEYYEKLAAFYKVAIKPDELIPDEEPEKKESLTQTVIRKLIEYAVAEVGVREKGTTNTGVRVNEYQLVGSCGEVKKGGSPWCSYYVKFIIRAVLKFFMIEDFMQCGGYTPSDRQWGIKKGIAVKVESLDDIEAGDIFLIYGSARGDAVHTGFVKGKKNGRVITNEGNTNSAGSADGGGVENRLRSWQGLWYVLKWWKLIE